MKKLLRNQATGYFLTRRGKWTRDIRKAADFTTWDAMANRLGKLPVGHYEIYYWFGARRSSEYDFSISL